MINASKKMLRRVSAFLAALAIAFTITGFTTAGAASADEVGVQAITCYDGTAWGYPGGNPGAGELHYAWARCNDDNPYINLYDFRVEWSCTGEGYMRYGAWHEADGTTVRGWCGSGKRVDVVRHSIRDMG